MTNPVTDPWQKPNPWNKVSLDWFENARRGPFKFLHDLDRSHFAQRTPIVSVSCADYKRNFDMIRQIAFLRGFEAGEYHLTHRLGWHGGIVRIVEESPMNPIPRSDEVFLTELLEAHEITNLFDYVVYAHWPCGKALKHGLGIHDVVDHLMRARIRLKEQCPAIKVKTLFHVDLLSEVSDKGMKSYFADPKDYAVYLDSLKA